MTDPNIIYPGSRVLIKDASATYLSERGVSVGDIMIVSREKGESPFNLEEDHGLGVGRGDRCMWLYTREFELLPELTYNVEDWTID